VVLDIAGVDGRTPWSDYRSLRAELKLHNPLLAVKPFLVAANKMDLAAAAENLKRFGVSSRLSQTRIFPISALTGDGLDELKKALFSLAGEGETRETV
jgi:GTP-binding protein